MAGSCDPRATSVFDDDRSRELHRVPASGQFAELVGQFTVPSVHRVRYRIAADDDECPSRFLRSASAAPVLAASVWPVWRRSWNDTPTPTFFRARTNA